MRCEVELTADADSIKGYQEGLSPSPSLFCNEPTQYE